MKTALLLCALAVFISLWVMASLFPPNKPTAADVNELHSTVMDLRRRTADLEALENEDARTIARLQAFLCAKYYLHNCMDKEANSK